MKIWKTLLLVYRELDVRLPVDSRKRRFHHIASEHEVADALDSFAGFPQLVSGLTGGRAGIEYEIVRPDHALTSLTRESSSRFWPSPDDIRSDLDEFAPPGRYDSVFVFWPQRDLKNGTGVPCDAWGLAIGASKWTNGATYAAIANAPSFAWTNEARGEVWLTNGCTGFVRILRSAATSCPSAMPMAANYTVMFAHRRPVGPITIVI